MPHATKRRYKKKLSRTPSKKMVRSSTILNLRAADSDKPECPIVDIEDPEVKEDLEEDKEEVLNNLDAYVYLRTVKDGLAINPDEIVSKLKHTHHDLCVTVLGTDYATKKYQFDILGMSES